MPELKKDVEITLHDNKLIFLTYAPAEVKKEIRRRFKHDKQFREEIKRQCQRVENTTDALKK